MEYKYKDCMKKKDFTKVKNDYRDTGIRDWKIISNDYCNYCGDVYHKMCDKSIEDLNIRINNIKTKVTTIKELNNIKNKCEEYINDITTKELSDNQLEQIKLNAKTVYKKLNTCKTYRESHHSSCVYYTGKDPNQIKQSSEGKGDSTHKHFIGILEDTSDTCLSAYNKVKNKKKVLSINYKSISPKIKSSKYYKYKRRY